MPSRQELAAFKARLLTAIQRLEQKKRTRLSQTDLAGRWGVSQSIVSVWVSGRGIPDREQIKTIAADCDVDPGWLDYGTTYDPGESGPLGGEGGARKRS